MDHHQVIGQLASDVVKRQRPCLGVGGVLLCRIRIKGSKKKKYPRVKESQKQTKTITRKAEENGTF